MSFPPSEQSGLAGAEREYRIAFEEFSQQARNFQLLTAQPNRDRAAVDAALLDLEKAHLAYTYRRNVLANRLSRAAVDGESLSGKNTRSPDVNADRIRTIAKLLWEVAGRPEGSAREDWYRAEEIIRRAVAAQISPGIELNEHFPRRGVMEVSASFSRHTCAST
jgi:hypothetical protein